MNKAALSEAIAAKHHMSKKDVEALLDTFEATVIEQLQKGDEVTLTGFGTFSAKKRAGRMGVDPREPSKKIQIPEVTIPKFKAGKTLKEALKGSGKESQTSKEKEATPNTPS